MDRRAVAIGSFNPEPTATAIAGKVPVAVGSGLRPPSPLAPG